MKRSRFTLIGLPLAFVLASGVFAKLPPPSEEAKAKAAEAAAKAEWSAKRAAFETCQAQERVAARFFAEMKCKEANFRNASRVSMERSKS